MRNMTLESAAIVILLSGAKLGFAANYYVSPTGGGNCTTGWGEAYSLATALTAATSGDEIWVKTGNYDPFSLKNGVKIIGGFAGSETSASQSDPSANPTIVDGAGSSQCIFSTNDGPSTVLRGFTVQNGFDALDNGGGGLVLSGSSAIFVQCIFTNNKAEMFGAAVAVRADSTPQFINCTFRDNGDDGGTPADGSDDKPLGGGAVYVYKGTPSFSNCLFHDNIAGEGGSLLIFTGSATLTNCTLADNKATLGDGGAIHDELGTTTIRNSILWGNTALGNGAQIYNRSDSTTTVAKSDVQGGFTGTGNINSDPLFQAPGSDDYRIQTGSPCKDVGQNSYLPTDIGDLDWDNNTGEQLPKDLGGLARRNGVVVDMGAHEAKSKNDPTQ